MKSRNLVRLRWYHKVVLVGFSLLLAVLIIEIAGRALDLLPHTADPLYQAVSRRVGVLPAPYDSFDNRGFVAGNTEFEVEVELNGLGFRAEDVAPEPAGDTQRVLLFGDSYTASWEVARDDMWSAWLSRSLNSGNQAFEVVNLGMPGFGTTREYLLYQAYGRVLHPNVVILVMYLENDIVDNGIGLWKPPGQLVGTRPYFLLDERGNLVEHPWHYVDKTRPYLYEDFPQNIIGWMNVHSVTYRVLNGRLGESTSKLEADDEDANIDPLKPERIPHTLRILFTDLDHGLDTAWEITEALIAALRDAVEADGAEFVVVLVPPHMIVQNEYWPFNALFEQQDRAWDLYNPQRRLAVVLDDLAIPFLDPTQAFIDFRAATGQDLFWKYDHHFNPTGSCLFGTLLANWFVEQGYMPTESDYPRDPLAVCGS
jgi:hypothetical protein